MHRAGLFAGAARCDILWSDGALKLLSSGLPASVKAAPLQAQWVFTGDCHPRTFEDEDDDEYENDEDDDDRSPQNKSVRVGYNDAGPAITRFPFQRPSPARKSLMTPPAA